MRKIGVLDYKLEKPAMYEAEQKKKKKNRFYQD